MNKDKNVNTWTQTIVKLSLIILVPVILVFGATIYYAKQPKPKYVSPQSQVTTEITQFTKGGFDAVMIADFKITNNTPITVKDIEVTCNGFAETGTLIDSNKRIIYKELKPGQILNVNKFNMGYVHSSVNSTSCKTTKFSI